MSRLISNPGSNFSLYVDLNKIEGNVACNHVKFTSTLSTAKRPNERHNVAEFFLTDFELNTLKSVLNNFGEQ